MRFWKCDLSEKCDFENVIFVIIRLVKCDFSEKCDFENAIFVQKSRFWHKSMDFQYIGKNSFWTKTRSLE